MTPIPGHTLGGHSIDAGTGYGTWMRLYARAIYVESPAGEPMVLVSCDLWAIPAGLADRVAELVRSNPTLTHISREDILVAATHTHHSPAGYSSNLFYNRYAGARGGFDARLHDFLARRIARAIEHAYTSRQVGQPKWSTVIVDGLARNRSFEPFSENPEATDVLANNRKRGISACRPIEDPPVGGNVDPQRCRAVFPELGVLSFFAQDGHSIASAAFVAVHPTVMPNDLNLYHGDLFGVAADRAEEALADDERRPVVAVFNGAEGDVSPAWVRHDASETIRLGQRLASAIVRGHRQLGTDPGSAIENRLRRVGIADVQTAEGRTSDRPIPGKGQLGGAEDHRTVWYRRGYREGVRASRERYRGQGLKRPALPVYLAAFGVPKDSLPTRVPVSVHRLGDLVLAGVPGEATTTLGIRLRKKIMQVQESRSVVLVGLADEYFAYFATPEEYALQHYEGASMMFGPHTAQVLLRTTGALASPEVTYRAQDPYVFVHSPGPRVRRALRHGPNRRKMRKTTRRILDVFANESPELTVSLTTAPPDWPNADARMIPELILDILDAGRWVPHPENALGWVVVIKHARQHRWTWEALWTGALPHGTSIRVRVLGVHSDAASGSLDLRRPFQVSGPGVIDSITYKIRD